MFAEEFLVVDGDSPLWGALGPLLNVALRLDQSDGSMIWHGWRKSPIERFLGQLPSPCSLLVCVWEPTSIDEEIGSERLVLGALCEVVNAEVRTVRSVQALFAEGTRSIVEMEPGISDAMELMRLAKREVAPVAWGLFTDKRTWDEWLLTEISGEPPSPVDKEDLLASLARQGRCVLLGSEVSNNHA